MGCITSKNEEEENENDQQETAVAGVHDRLEEVRTEQQEEDVAQLEKELGDIQNRFRKLIDEWGELQKANNLHEKFAASLENLKHTYNFDATIRSVEQSISDNKFLDAHKHIMDLELSRDELLFELHKLDGSELNKQCLIKFFGEVDKLVKTLAEKIWFVIERALEMVKRSEIGNGPQELMTCLRIVEREERIDCYYLERQNVTFMPPGRPRRWREEAFKVLEKTVWSRMEGMQIEDRERNESWLAKYLEMIQVVLKGDLLSVQDAAKPYFPQEYQIFDRFVDMYHQATSRRLRGLANEVLLKHELVQLLSWIRRYKFVYTPASDICYNCYSENFILRILSNTPLLSLTTLKELHVQFIEMTRKDIKNWLRKTVDLEKKDWYNDKRPEEDTSNGYFYTDLPSTLFRIIDENVSICEMISDDLITLVIHVNIEQLIGFADNCIDAALAYKKKCFENRRCFTSMPFKNFTSIMIAIANNLQTCIENKDNYMRHIPSGAYDVASLSDLSKSIDNLNEKWKDGILKSGNALLEEVMIDINLHIDELFSKQWLQSSLGIETICMTIKEYYVDHLWAFIVRSFSIKTFIILRPAALFNLMSDLQYRVVAGYLKAVESKRLQFSNYNERESARKRLIDDADRIQGLFGQVPHGGIKMPGISRFLKEIASVVSQEKKPELLQVATKFGCKFYGCGIDVEFLKALLTSREDVNAIFEFGASNLPKSQQDLPLNHMSMFRLMNDE